MHKSILHDRAPSRAHVSDFSRTTRKRLPAYSRRLNSAASPVFVSPEWAIARECLAYGGLCLVVDDDPTRFDFTFLRGRLVWLLFRDDRAAALELAKAIAAYVDDGSELVKFPRRESRA